MSTNAPSLLFYLLATLSVFVTPVSAKSDSVAKVIANKGKVEIQRQDKILKAKRRDELKTQDVVKTGNKARAQFKFNDGTITTLGADSEMVVKEFDWQDGEKSPSAEFTLVKGVFRTVTGLITKVDDPKYKVHTPLGSIGIRGTDFWGGYLDENAIDVLFVAGEHAIEVSNEFGTVMLEKPGQGTTIKPGTAPSKPKAWPAAKVERAVKTITLD
ncbi:MAG: FecR domain-containing protein [Gammaproteobacteria bacterium]|nr:FecR domain-containing protein [Gammaproteobacteria bacterium]